MTPHRAEEPTTTTALHRLLLRVSGHAPDELVVLARRWLADDWLTGVAQSLGFAASAGQIPLTEPDCRLLAEVLEAAGEDHTFLTGLSRPAVADPPQWAAAPADGELDDGDKAAVAAVSDLTGVAGLWRAWRVCARGGLFPPPKRVHLVQASTGLPAVAGRLQEALVAAGEPRPLVEVFDDLSALPGLGRRLLGAGDLIWADRPARQVRLAAAFDTYEPDGTPAFAAVRPRLTGLEADLVAAYLEAGTLLLGSPDLAPDVLDPAGSRSVPTGLRGDGRWIWSEATAYYLTRYGVAPDPGLLMTIRAAGYTMPPVDEVTAHRSRAVLLAGLEPPPAPGDPARVAGGEPSAGPAPGHSR